jgi:hypothetical protein
MLGKISGFFWRIAGWKTFLAGLFIYMFFATEVMPYGVKMFRLLSRNEKIEILDLQFSYSPEKARAIIAEYGDGGRLFAARFEMTMDTAYPLAYTFLFIITIAWIYKALSRYGIVYAYIHLLPLLGMMADYCENICIVTMFKNYPGFSDTVARLSSFFTSLKWSLVGVEVLVILVGLGLLVNQRFIRKQNISGPDVI